MFKISDIFDRKYRLDGLAPDVGGMGKVLFAIPVNGGKRVAIKHCKEHQYYDRFRREVRILEKYFGNTKVVQLLDMNLEFEPPYFVMPFAENGDLSLHVEKIIGNQEVQEQVFFRMIDAVAELHSNGDIHRDIKPQNFLLFSGAVVVSDLGLAKDANTGTVFTKTMDRGGTEEFAPPEYYKVGGFKNAKPQWDIFSLGKSFYRLITNRHAQHLSPEGIPPSIYYVIKRCCEVREEDRFSTLSVLRPAVKDAFDPILKRLDPFTDFQNKLDSIVQRLKKSSEYLPDEINRLFVALGALDKAAQTNFAENISLPILRIISEDQRLTQNIEWFLDIYAAILEEKKSQRIDFSYAETVATKMKIIFDSANVSFGNKSKALDLAIIMAVACNRFAAMATCAEMIKSVTDDGLGMAVGEIIKKYATQSFICSIEPIACSNQTVRSRLADIRNSQKEDPIW